MRTSLLVLVALVSRAASPEHAKPSPLAADIESFCVCDWSSVYDAKKRLASREAEAIPELIKLAFRRERVPLTDTADLIYPGAKTFYGHGFIVDYDLDYLAARAGWLLEEITFKDFGFAAGSISEPRLFDAIRRGKHDVPLTEAVPQPKGPRDFKASAEKARTWWLSNSGTWTRFGAVKEALGSTSERSQMTALGWLRGNTIPCAALPAQSCASELRPLVQRLTERGSTEVRQQARLLLQERGSDLHKLTTPAGPR